LQAAPKAKAAPKAAAAPKATKAPAKKAATSKKTTTTKGKSTSILADLDDNAQADDQDSDAMQIDSEFEEEAAPKTKKKGPVGGAAAKQNKSASETYQKVSSTLLSVTNELTASYR
jgi:hypothetical protein